jgi:hypothetical protein
VGSLRPYAYVSLLCSVYVVLASLNMPTVYGGEQTYVVQEKEKRKESFTGTPHVCS